MDVLIVDDSDTIQYRLKKSLTDEDHNISIFQARTCKEATDLFLPHLYDTIILDIALPDGSGINLLREIRRLNLKTQVIIFTNYPTMEFKSRCIELGADHFFNKTEIADLLHVVINHKTETL